MSLKDLPKETRPREKLLALGPASLSDTELLALLLGTGVAGKGVLQLAAELLQLPTEGPAASTLALGGVAGLLHAKPKQLARIRGLGPAKRSVILAVIELARRALSQQLESQEVLSDPTTMRRFLQMHLAHLPHEVFAVCFLNVQNRLLALEPMFRGSLRQAAVYPREVVMRALHHGAAAVVLAHNHPSGSVQPSEADVTLTGTLSAALGLVDVRVVDHIIVAPGVTLSMAEHGLL